MLSKPVSLLLFLLIPLLSYKLPGSWLGYAVCLSGLARLCLLPSDSTSGGTEKADVPELEFSAWASLCTFLPPGLSTPPLSVFVPLILSPRQPMVMLYLSHPHGKKSSGPAVRTVGFFGQAPGSLCWLLPLPGL